MNQMFNWLSTKVTAFALIAMLGLLNFASVDARLVFTTEGDGTLIDQDLDGDSNFSLFFGTSLGEEIEFDVANDRFNISNDIQVTGNVTATGNVNAVDANFTGNADVDGTLNADGAATLGSTLNVTGATTVQSTFNGQGAADFDSTLNVDGAATLQNNLTVVGTSDLQGNISDSLGDVTVDDNLNVTGNGDVDGTFNADGAATLGSTLNVTGATIVQNTFNGQGAADFDSTLNADGATTLGNTLNVTGATTLQSTLNGQGAVDFDSTLNVDSTSTFGDDITLNNDAEIINLRAENAATAGAPVCTDATDLGRIYYDTDTEKLLFCQQTGPSTFAWTSTSSTAGSASNTFYAEFANFSVWADGSNNRGTMRAEYDDTDDRSYYLWRTRRVATQDYDVVLQWQVPDNFSEFDTGAVNHLQFDIETVGAAGSVDLRDVQVNGADQSISDTANTAAAWATQDVDLTSATIAAGDTMTLRFTVFGDSVSTASLSNVKINYLQQ